MVVVVGVDSALMTTSLQSRRTSSPAASPRRRSSVIHAITLVATGSGNDFVYFLGIRGGSNGGLLMGNVFVQRPDLFGAVCCAVPLLNMRAYSTLLAGASWMAEYGDPQNPNDWAFLSKYSPYHHIALEGGAQHYPALLMTTSTRDDRVHPYHARCFVKRLVDRLAAVEGPAERTEESEAVQRGDVLYYENIEGGHGAAADNKQSAFMDVSASSGS